MAYKEALWDGSDPSYAPGAVRGRNYWYWKPSGKFRQMGYAKTSVRLTGEHGDGQDLLRARECRELTREMLAFFGVSIDKHEPGTWGWLIHRYKTDRHSPIHGVKQNTREGYIWALDRWDAAIGHVLVSKTDYVMICDLRDAMKAKGRNDGYVSRMFDRLRTVAKYGKLVKYAPARDVSEILSDMRFQSAPRRAVTPTRAQIRAIVDEADARGLFGFATGLLIQWVFCLRAVDVRGQWLECDADASGIVRKRERDRKNRHLPDSHERWQDGLTWDMLDPGLTYFDKVISKTSKSMPDPIRFALTDAPEIRARLSILALRGRSGPVITSERTGLPYTRYGWSQVFRRIRDDLGLPKDLTVMDTRAGALTEAKNLGVDPFILRDAGQHLHVSTTDRYARGRSESIAKVVKLRSGS
ncbi:recombinase [Pseudooceanicola sp. CBS1P-1]|uniref:Recombinase n=1 Tax=Pseudooceanicola albus TaxID=2692189 RepID=A0A6L7GBF7_9RHOB|nr:MULTISPECIES: recombinase [Pseudooceanicola]MBT9384490.1 recombinase [Pseudooceanicola endophyticus]MXN20610.1 recombinase [Pseudooceanicola albus]